MDLERRLLIYSHDTFGLGHLRRCRAIAHDLVDRFPKLSVLILSGSPIIGSFDFRARVDFVRIPGVIKLRNGAYTPLKLHIDIDKTVAMRSSIIQHTAKIFDPHLFIVDKEPLGLRGEVEATLQMLKQRGTPSVLGLRDVIDDPESVREEWTRKKAFIALRRYYDGVWVYGLPEIFDPVAEIEGMKAFASKTRFTGYIPRSVPDHPGQTVDYRLPERPFVLVTAGGGGDGGPLIDWVISAYEMDPSIPFAALIVFGPFMSLEERAGFQVRLARLSMVQAVTFESHIEHLYEQADAIVAMGGYNTFCEILSFEKPALVVPRSEPRQEQLLRAERAESLGLLRMLIDDGAREPKRMVDALYDLPRWPRPSRVRLRSMLSGLDRIADLAQPWLGDPEQPRRLTRSA